MGIHRAACVPQVKRGRSNSAPFPPTCSLTLTSSTVSWNTKAASSATHRLRRHRRGEGGRERGREALCLCESFVCVCQDRHKRRRKRSREAHSTLSNGIFPLQPPQTLHTPTPLRPPIHRGTHNHPPSMGRHDLLTAHTACTPPTPPPRLSPLSTPRAVAGDLRGPLARTSTTPRAPRHTLPLSCTPTPPPPLPPAPPSSPSNLK